MIGCSDIKIARSFSNWYQRLYLQSLEWEVNLEKSSLTPGQSFEYLDLCFRSDLEIVRPADRLLDRLHRDLNILMRKMLVTPWELQSFLGMINFFAPRYGRIQSGTPVKSATGFLLVHGQFDGRVGGIPKCERRLEMIPQVSPHQSLGNVGSQVSIPTLQVRDTVTNCTPFMHHRNCGELSAEGGRNSI